LKDDEVLLLMGLSSSQLGTNKLGEMIYKAAYSILSGAIPLSCNLHVKSNVNGVVKIYKNGVSVYQVPTNTPFKLPILVNVTLSVESPGYKTYTTTLPALYGDVTLNVNLEPENPEGSSTTSSSVGGSDSSGTTAPSSGGSDSSGTTAPSSGGSATASDNGSESGGTTTTSGGGS
jgi:hypothetical protein